MRDLIETNPSATDIDQAAALFRAHPHLNSVVMLDRNERPTGIADLESLAVGMTSNALQVNNDTPLADAARRAIVRPRHSPFQPLVCTDNAGRYAGIVSMERLIDKLAAIAQQSSSPR